MSSDIKLTEVNCPICDQCSDEITASGYDFEYATTDHEFTFRRCPACKVVYLSPRPVPSELSRIYPPEYNPFHFNKIRNPIIRWGRQYTQKAKASAIRKLLGETANVLDVGCGSCALLSLLKKLAPPGWRLYGNDMSEDALLQAENLGFEKIKGRFEEVETAQRFDLIILNQTIEHLDDPVKIIEKSAELLLPGGILFIETPCILGLDAKCFRRRYWGGYHIPRHWILFSPDALKSLLHQHGFRVVETKFLASPSFWIQSFHHYFLDHGYSKYWVKFWQFRNPALLALFVLLDRLTIAFGHPSSNVRVVASKGRKQSGD